MSYKYREVKCPWCDHVFMWNESGGEGLVICEYRLKENGKYVDKTICPKCEMDILVLEHLLEGITSYDDRVELRGVRGI